MFFPVVCLSHAELDLDDMALLFLFTVIIVLCLLSSCFEDGEHEGAARAPPQRPRAEPRQTAAGKAAQRGLRLV